MGVLEQILPIKFVPYRVEMTGSCYSALLNHEMWTTPATSWPWMRLDSIAKADPAGADSWKLSAYTLLSWAISFSAKGICVLHLCLPQGGGLFSAHILVVCCTNGVYKIFFCIYNTPLSIKLNGFPCLATQYTSLTFWVSVCLPIKQGGSMGLPVLKAGDS